MVTHAQTVNTRLLSSSHAGLNWNEARSGKFSHVTDLTHLCWQAKIMGGKFFQCNKIRLMENSKLSSHATQP